MSKYLTPEIEANELGLKLKSKPNLDEPIDTAVNTASNAVEKENIENETLIEKQRKVIKEKLTGVFLNEPQEKTPNQIQTSIKPKKTPSKLQQLIDFILLSGIIFAIVFLVMNFSAYKQIVVSYLFPEKQFEKTENLKEAVGTKPIKQILISVDNSKKHIKKTFPPLDFKITPPDNRIIIPKIGKNIPLIDMETDHLEGENWSELENQIQEGLREGVVHYPGTSVPGQFGNVFITGHSSYYPWDKGNYKEVFALLPSLEVNDEYHIFYNQKKYSYRIKEKKEVYPDNVQVLKQPENEKISTLMTCVPVGTALRRLIIIAEEI